MAAIYTIAWAVAQGLSVISPREEWGFSPPQGWNGRGYEKGNPWTVRVCERPHDRMPSISHMRQGAIETREDFIARLCESGESDDCFGRRETRSHIQASGALHDLEWLPTQD